MGFNLKAFFDELLNDLSYVDVNDCEAQIKNIIEEVKAQQKYAQECGLIDES
jgi:hypothetical protein